MPQTSFTCPNKHTFQAIAKLRARCPTCGVMTRRDFSTAIPIPSIGQKKRLSSTAAIAKPEDTPITSVRGSKLVSTSTPVKKLESQKVVSKEPESQTLTKPSPRIVRMGMKRPAPKTPVRTVTQKTRQVVKRKTASHGASPSIKTSLPKGSKERKVVEQLTDEGPYWQQVKRKFFR